MQRGRKKMRKNWKKVLSLVLAASLVLSLNVFAFAAEMAEMAAPAEEIEEIVDFQVAEEVSENAAVSADKVVATVSESGIVVTVSYDAAVTYDGRKHIEVGGKASGSKAADVTVSINIVKDGKVVTPKKVKLGFKLNKDATVSGAKALAAKPKKKDKQAYFTVKVTFDKTFKKENKAAVKAITKALKGQFFSFEIQKADLAALSMNAVKAKVKKLPANGTPDAKTKVSGLKFDVKFMAKKGEKTKSIALKQAKKNDAKADEKKAKDFYVYSVDVSANKVVVSTNSATKNFTGSAEVQVAAGAIKQLKK